MGVECVENTFLNISTGTREKKHKKVMNWKYSQTLWNHETMGLRTDLRFFQYIPIASRSEEYIETEYIICCVN